MAMNGFGLRRFTRRGFLSRSGWFIAGLSLLPLIQNFPLQANPGTRVGIIKSGNRKEALKRSLELIPPPDVSGKKILIKPNFNTADPAPGSTHNDTLETLIDELWDRGAGHIIIGERSGPPDSHEVMEEKGIFQLAREKEVEVINFDHLAEDEMVHFDDERLHWRNGFHIPRILSEVDHVIATPCLKTHQFGGVFTMALKLAVGIIPNVGTDYMRELHGSTHMRRMIAEINLAYSPDLFVVDGVEAFTTGGPASGTRKNAEVTLVSKDPVAVDAVGVAVLKQLGSTRAIMDTPIFEQEQIARAAEIGLGVTDPGQIELLSDGEPGEAYAEEIRKILDSE